MYDLGGKLFRSTNGGATWFSPTGNAPGGGQDIAFTLTGRYGGFQPYSSVPGNFNNTPYTDLTFQMKAASASSQYAISAENTGDQPAGPQIDLSQFAQNTVNGWTTYKVPLTALGVAGQTNEYKFGIQDKTDPVGSTTYFDNIQFA